MLKSVLIAASAAMTLSASAGFAATYDCKIATGGEALGWISRSVTVTSTTEVTVSDDLIQSLYDKPVAGKLSRENGNVIVFTWEVDAYDSTNQHARLKYRLTVQKADGRAQISATPLGYANSFTAQGACKVG